ncbi:hypothetical protein MUP79_10235 [Candidatus Bathyarchaeota archaeon]|nr:hypothetical protein [Candidatus Bathyarchaeota archaeon]
MVNFKFFSEAKFIYECGDVFFLSANEHSARFMVAGKEVRIETTLTGTKFHCTCEHHLQHQLQDKLCKRIVATIIYIYFKRGRLKKT